MCKTSVVISYRKQNSHDYLDVFLKYIDQEVVGEIIVVNLSSSPLDVASPKTRVIETGYDGIFSRSWAMNIGIKAAKMKYITTADADVIMHPNILPADISFLEDNPLSYVVHPYCFTKEHNNHKALDEKRPWPERYTENSYPSEGCITILRKHLLHIRGYNEYLVGWGFEDNELGDRLRQNNIKRIMTGDKIENTVIHIWHPRTTSDNKEYPLRHEINKQISSAIKYEPTVWGELNCPPDMEHIKRLQGENNGR